MIFLYLPMTCGAQMIYAKFVRPFHLKHHNLIDNALSGIQDRKLLFVLF